MKSTKCVFGVYSAWDYAREIEDLNKMSGKGWQLVKGGLLVNKYKKNDNVQYRYQLDYNTHIDDMGRYIETFREQGWEYVNSTINGWHYFRKLYDSSLPQEEYEIYCDNQSLKEMQNNWKKMAVRMSVVLGIAFLLELFAAIRDFNLTSISLCVTLFIEFVMLLRGVIVMRKPQRTTEEAPDAANNIDKKAFGGHRITIMFVILFAGLALSIAGLFL